MSEEHSVDSEESTIDHPYLWTDERGRTYVGEGGQGGDIIRLSRLTAIAEYGFEEVVERGKHVHHALAADGPDGERIRIDAPRFLFPQSRKEHLSIHGDEEWKEVDGIPLLLPDEEPDDADEGGEPHPSERPTEVTA